MKITITKAVVNALIRDIINWTLNFTIVAFMWQVSPKFAVAISCLTVMRELADFLFRRSMQQEMMEQRERMIQQIQQLEQADTTNQETFDFGTVTPIKPKSTDDQVH